MTDSFSSFTHGNSTAAAVGCPQDMCLFQPKWFVMRVTYSRELKAQRLLQAAGVTTFIPMRRERDETGNNYLPVVHNLIFVHTSREFMDEYKRKVEGVCPMRYMMDKSTGLPIVVRDRDMDDFISVTANAESDIMYLDDPAAAAVKGTPVEIVAGPFKGVQGRLLRIRKDRKVVLQLAGVVAAALSGVPMEYLRVVED